MPKTIIAANWKMFKTISEAKEFLQQIKQQDLNADRETVLCGPYTTLTTLQQELQGSSIKFGAENMYWEEEGAFTGEISPLMLKDLGCQYIIIGHSERRQLFGETDETVNKKLKSALKHDLVPIFCVGETLEQRESGETEKVIEEQIKKGLEGIDDISKIVVAYEPVWAIGTGKTATPEQAQEVHALIRKKTTVETSILYGGSVKPDNAAELMNQPDINGALVGGASLEVESFVGIINY